MINHSPVILDIAGQALNADDRRRLQHPLTGGLILFTRNFTDRRQLTELTAEVKALRPDALITVDHEGGRVQRFRRDGFTHVAAMRVLGELWMNDAMRAIDAACAAGFVLGAELRACGVELSWTPVVDLDHRRSEVVGDRAFHRDPRVVSVLAQSQMLGLLRAGMANCGKHFPGHGWAEADSHVALPVDRRSRTDILKSDAAPYRWLGPMLAGVMPAHVVYPQIDQQPAGFSRHWIHKVLRGQLGFTGAVFSDDLLMAGAGALGSIAERAAAALDAGCDFALVCNDTDAMDQVLGAIKWERSAVFDGRLARLQPHGTALSMGELVDTDLYRNARRDLAEAEKSASV